MQFDYEQQQSQQNDKAANNTHEKTISYKRELSLIDENQRRSY